MAVGPDSAARDAATLAAVAVPVGLCVLQDVAALVVQFATTGASLP